MNFQITATLAFTADPGFVPHKRQLTHALLCRRSVRILQETDTKLWYKRISIAELNCHSCTNSLLHLYWYLASQCRFSIFITSDSGLVCEVVRAL